MKKTTIILAGLALIAASCAKTEVVSSGPEGGEKGISFSAYTARPTKAQDVTTGNLESFKATAIGNSAVYFDGVTFNKSTTYWESNPAYLWPAYALDFYAYNTPAEGHGTFTPTINTSSQTIKVVPSTTLAEQEDLVAACAKNQTEKYDNGTNAIALTFNHYLTQVVVKAKNSSSKHTVVVDGVKLANLAGEGTYSFSDNKMTATAANINSNNSADYSETFTEKTLTAEAQEVMTNEGTSGRWYLIPQTVKAWDQANNKTNTDAANSTSGTTYDYGTYLALKVKISASSEKIYPVTGKTSAWMAVPVPEGLKFEQGKKYNVTVDFFSQDNNGAGYVDPEEPGELDGNTTNSDAGKKISGIIKFSATVNTWGDSVDITISL